MCATLAAFSLTRTRTQLYEPALYPHNPTEPLFARVFGVDRAARDAVCSFGFEPNPIHAARLARLEAAYTRKGRRVRIFSNAVSTADGNVTFYRDPGTYASQVAPPAPLRLTRAV